MTRERLFVAALLVDFVALNIYAFATAGLDGLWTFLSEMGPWGWVLSADVVLALSMCMYWMWRDARRRGASSTLEMVLTPLTGSVGPLLYLARRPAGEG